MGRLSPDSVKLTKQIQWNSWRLRETPTYSVQGTNEQTQICKVQSGWGPRKGVLRQVGVESQTLSWLGLRTGRAC